MRTDEVRWHRVNAGSDAKPMVWKFSGLREVIPFGASILLGLFALRVCLSIFSLDFVPSVMAALSVPLLFGAFLLRFVSGKPDSYLFHTAKWLTIRSAKRPLLGRQYLEDATYAQPTSTKSRRNSAGELTRKLPRDCEQSQEKGGRS